MWDEAKVEKNLKQSNRKVLGKNKKKEKGLWCSPLNKGSFWAKQKSHAWSLF